jgi:hypothetical protein
MISERCLNKVWNIVLCVLIAKRGNESCCSMVGWERAGVLTPCLGTAHIAQRCVDHGGVLSYVM